MQYHGGDIYRNQIRQDFSVNTNPLGMPDSVREALHQCGRDIFMLVIRLQRASIKASEEITFISNPSKYNHLNKLQRLSLIHI